MMRVRRRVWGVVLVVAVGGGALAQQRGERTPESSVGGELRALASRAGVVFVGQVEKIEPRDGVVDVTFTVQQPVLGLAGGSYVMHEWAGRWTGGQQRYWVGERAMFFLHAPSGNVGGDAASGGAAGGGAGLSSPVDGMIGVIPVVAVGTNGGTLLDVRWLATKLRRQAGKPMIAASTGGVALADAVTVSRNWQADRATEPKSVRLPDGLPAPAAAETPGWLQPKELGDARR